MDETPYELITRFQSSDSNEFEYIYNESPPYFDYELDKGGLEWFGVASAWRNAFNSGCAAYYPQLFYNRWVPLDTEEAERYGIALTPTPTPDPAYQGPNRDLFVPNKYIRE